MRLFCTILFCLLPLPAYAAGAPEPPMAPGSAIEPVAAPPAHTPRMAPSDAVPVQLTGEAPPVPVVEGPPAADKVETHPTFDSFFTLYQPHLSSISAYEPIYFLVGTDPAKSKFQFSFKYRFLDPRGPLIQKHPWIGGFHFAYTQTSFWDLSSDSMPFEDTSYKPELFHITNNIAARPDWAQGFFVKTSLHHESNGRSEQFSRSVNQLFLSPVFILYNPDSKLGLQIAPKFRTYFANGEHNADIEDYRGYVELDLKMGKADSFVFSALLRWAREGGSAELDLSYPLGGDIQGNFDVYLHIQYVNALAENLLYYQERRESTRIGLSFVR